MSLIITILIPIIFIICCIRCIWTVPADQVWVVERMGNYLDTWKKGLHIALPFVDKVVNKVPVRDQILDIPPLPALTKDNVEIVTDMFIFFTIFDPKKFTYGVNDPRVSMVNRTSSEIRNIIGTYNVEECLANRNKIFHQLVPALNEITNTWGIQVNRVENKYFTLPKEIQEALERKMAQAQEQLAERIMAAQEGSKNIANTGQDAAQFNPPSDDKLIEMVTQNEHIFEKLIDEILINDKLSNKLIEKTALNAMFVNKLKSKTDPSSLNSYF